MLGGSLVFVVLGFWMRSDHPVSGYVSIVFFGVCVLVFCVNLLPNSSYLRLAGEGFTVCSTFRSRFIEWRHVGTFGVTRVGTRKMVGWDPSHPVSTLGKTNQVMCGYASALPDTYGLRPEELAELLESPPRRTRGSNHLTDRRSQLRKLLGNCCSAQMSFVLGWRAHALAGTTPFGNGQGSARPQSLRPYSSSVIKPKSPCSSSAIPAVK